MKKTSIQNVVAVLGVGGFLTACTPLTGDIYALPESVVYEKIAEMPPRPSLAQGILSGGIERRVEILPGKVVQTISYDSGSSTSIEAIIRPVGTQKTRVNVKMTFNTEPGDGAHASDREWAEDFRETMRASALSEAREQIASTLLGRPFDESKVLADGIGFLNSNPDNLNSTIEMFEDLEADRKKAEAEKSETERTVGD